MHPIEVEEENGGSRTVPDHFVLVNVAPLVRICTAFLELREIAAISQAGFIMDTLEQVRGHLLFVLDMNLLKPQKMSEKFLLYALSISQAMQNETFALGTSTIVDQPTLLQKLCSWLKAMG